MISHITTLANGIIGVSVLAMPFCFKQCGIVLATLVLLLSSALSRLACHFLIKSAVMCRRRNFEFLAFHAFGLMGKFLVELCIIGFLLGTCIAYFVVVGDLGPQIIGEFLNKEPGDIRTSLLVTTAIFIVLPLGLLRNVSSLASVSIASIAFYACLVLKIVGDSTDHIFSADCFEKIHFWRPAGMLQCLPIFALALFCQTQLFEIYETMPNATLEKMNQVVRGALNICTVVYVFVGLFGYIGFCTQPFSGNILMSFEPSVTSEVIKIGFVLSVAFSFPLVIFPCRASLNSLLFRQGYTHLETSTSYISEARFRCLTTFIVVISMIVGILIPNIEFVLGIVGSTIGVLICLIFPAMFFISISTKNTNERLLAQILVIIGMWIMILGTYANLYAMEQSSNTQFVASTPKLPSQIINSVPNALVNDEVFAEQNQLKEPDNLLNLKDDVNKLEPKVPEKPPDEENVRREPPVPVERLPNVMKPKDKEPINVESSMTISQKVQEIINKIDIDDQLVDQAKKAFDSLKKIQPNVVEEVAKPDNSVPDKQEKVVVPKEEEKYPVPVKESQKVDEVDLPQKNDIAVDAIKKEESELAADKEILNVDPVQRREQLDKTLVKHIMEQKEMMQEQKELLKDIERNEKKLQQEIGSEKLKNVEDKIVAVNSDVEIKGESKVEEEKVVEIAKNEVDVPSLKENPAQSNAENNNGPKANVEKPQNESIKVNKINNDKSNEANLNKKMDALKGEESVRLVSLDSNANQGSVVKQSGDPIIRALTNQSNKIANEIQAVDVPKSNSNDNNDDSKDQKENVKQEGKNNEYSIPFVLKVRSQNKSMPKPNESNHDVVAPAHRNILEEHQREKRETEEKVLAGVKTVLNKSIEENKNTSALESIVVEKKEETCTKKGKEDQKIKEDGKVNDVSPSDLIKTSAYLSGQEVIKDIPIESKLNQGENLIKIKSRDLKSLKLDNTEI